MWVSGVGTPEFNEELGGQAKLYELYCERRPTPLPAKYRAVGTAGIDYATA